MAHSAMRYTMAHGVQSVKSQLLIVTLDIVIGNNPSFCAY